jgi:hypothetical protein
VRTLALPCRATSTDPATASLTRKTETDAATASPDPATASFPPGCRLRVDRRTEASFYPGCRLRVDRRTEPGEDGGDGLTQVVIGDGSNATSAGAPGDSGHLLAEMLRHRWPAARPGQGGAATLACLPTAARVVSVLAAG